MTFIMAFYVFPQVCKAVYFKPIIEFSHALIGLVLLKYNSIKILQLFLMPKTLFFLPVHLQNVNHFAG